MKKLLYHILLLLSSTGIFGQATISLNTPRTAGGTETACQSISLKPGFKFTATSSASLTLTANPTTCDPFAGATSSVSSSQNYIQTHTYTTDDGSRYMESIQYFDGLGRPVQAVQRGITPNTADLITLQEYDAFGREANSWLPAVASGNNGAYMPLATYKTKAMATYNATTYNTAADSVAYSRPVYEASPLNRILEQYGPGADWQKNGKAVKTAYMTNTAGGELSCKKFTVNGSGTRTSLSKSGNYAANQLYVTKMTDENQNVSYEFKDKLGQVVLTRQMNGTAHDTYYVYDDFGNLCYVIPPEYSDKITADGTLNAGLNVLWAYLYKYDGRNRCIAKKLPGCEYTYYVYDKADRLIFSQDGEQRKKGEWTLTIPDAFGRIVLTGTCKNTPDYTADPLKAVVVKGTWAKANNANKGYTVSGVTLTTPVILSANYYDSYEFMSYNGIPAITDANIKPETGTGYGTQYTGGYKGLLTGTLTARMNPDGTVNTTAYLYSVMYYDNRGRLVQAKSTSHLSGGIEKEYIAYNFTGQPVKKKHVHQATGKTTQTEVYAYTYDHAGRLVKETHQLNSGAAVTLAENTYDELGRLKTNKKNNQANLNTIYGYNVRSWTKSITSPLFNQTLYYNESYAGSTKHYNGNIGAMSWKIPVEGSIRGYVYSYDNLSRLRGAKFYVNAVANTNYDVPSITYDKHGNIKTLQRYGMTAAATYGIIDNLTMAYTGNQLIKVEDAAATVSLAESADFKNYSNTTTEYTYNANGAMSKDLNKGITAIQYNLLNLPRMMDIKSPVAEARNEYTYSSSGAKLKVVQKWNPDYSTAPVIGSAINTAALTMAKTTDYVGNKIYENGTLKRILVDGGYYEGGVYYHYLTDHLGNNRVVINAGGTVIQRTEYYPFGMISATSTEGNKQPYKYNGKELDMMHGVNWYDYSARLYDPVIPHFGTVDPLAEKYPWISPYAYCNNNPVKYIDPDGLDWVMRGIGGNAYYYYDKDVKSWDDIKNKYGDGKIAGNMSLIKEGQQVKITGKDGNSMVYTFSNENKSFTDADGNALGEMDIMAGKGFAIIGTGDKNVDGATLHNNLFGTSTTGGNNPRTNDKTEEYFGYLPFQTNQDNYSLKHDVGYASKGANGAASAFTNLEVLPDDYKLAGRNTLNALNPVISERERWRSIGTAAAFGAISVVKTIVSPVLSPFVYKKKGTK